MHVCACLYVCARVCACVYVRIVVLATEWFLWLTKPAVCHSPALRAHECTAINCEADIICFSMLVTKQLPKKKNQKEYGGECKMKGI